MTTTVPQIKLTNELTPEKILEFRTEFGGNEHNRLIQNAITKTGLQDIALNREIVSCTQNTFSKVLDDWKVTNQKRSGRCWIFAGLNLLRAGMAKKLNLKEFELSQNFSFFWDQFERANLFLAHILDTADRPVDDRVVAHLLEFPVEDGGQWNMFVNVVRKYGLVPKSAMPESESSSNTRTMRTILNYKLREGAMILRTLTDAGASPAELAAARDDVLSLVFRVLCLHLGTPPESFDWQWTDKDKAFHRDGEITPLEFTDRYLDLNLDEFVCLVNDPRESSPFGRTFTVDRLGNVLGGDIVKYLNVEIGLLKRLTARMVENGEPVWFGCDVGKMMDRKLGLWDVDLYDHRIVYAFDFPLTKAQRLEYHETRMTHAMLFTGVDMVDGEPRRFRVENSWGDENEQQGYYTMNENWFDEYMFEVAVPKSYLPDDLLPALEEEPIVLPPWDPMGALAG